MAASAPSSRPLHFTERTVRAPDGSLQEVTVNLKECPLTWLRARAHITDRQFRAGEALQMDWEKAGLGARVTMRWDPVLHTGRGGGAVPGGMTDRALSAKERLDGAMSAAGAGLRDVLWRVVCAGEGLAAAERALGWPARAGKLVLGFALDRVADFYRVP